MRNDPLDKAVSEPHGETQCEVISMVVKFLFASRGPGLIVASSILCVSACAAPDHQPNALESRYITDDEAVELAEDATGEETVCRTRRVTGSSIPQRICMTREAFERARAESEAFRDESRRGSDWVDPNEPNPM